MQPPPAKPHVYLLERIHWWNRARRSHETIGVFAEPDPLWPGLHSTAEDAKATVVVVDDGPSMAGNNVFVGTRFAFRSDYELPRDADDADSPYVLLDVPPRATRGADLEHVYRFRRATLGELCSAEEGDIVVRLDKPAGH